MMQEPVYVCKDNSLFYEYLPNDLITTLGKPHVYSGSNTGPMADDFEFRYKNLL